MDSWKRVDETSLSDTKEFFSNLNMKDITDVDYRHAKRVYIYIVSILLLADVFGSFRKLV